MSTGLFSARQKLRMLVNLRFLHCVAVIVYPLFFLLFCLIVSDFKLLLPISSPYLPTRFPPAAASCLCSSSSSLDGLGLIGAMRGVQLRRAVMFVLGCALTLALVMLSRVMSAEDTRACAKLANSLTSLHFSAGLPWPQVRCDADLGECIDDFFMDEWDHRVAHGALRTPVEESPETRSLQLTGAMLVLVRNTGRAAKPHGASQEKRDTAGGAAAPLVDLRRAFDAAAFNFDRVPVTEFLHFVDVDAHDAARSEHAALLRQKVADAANRRRQAAEEHGREEGVASEAESDENEEDSGDLDDEDISMVHVACMGDGKPFAALPARAPPHEMYLNAFPLSPYSALLVPFRREHRSQVCPGGIRAVRAGSGLLELRLKKET